MGLVRGSLWKLCWELSPESCDDWGGRGAAKAAALPDARLIHGREEVS